LLAQAVGQVAHLRKVRHAFVVYPANSWTAREFFLPRLKHHATNPSRSKSSRVGLHWWPGGEEPLSVAVNVHSGERRNRFRGAAGRGRLKPLHRVAASMLSAKSARMVPLSAFLGVGGAHEVAVFQDGVFAFEDLDHDWARDHEVDQVFEEGARSVHARKKASASPRLRWAMRAATDFEASASKACVRFGR
jgi:hypothetical protein